MAAVAARSHLSLGTRMFDDRSTVRSRGIGRSTRDRCGGDPCDRRYVERAERRVPLCAHRRALTQRLAVRGASREPDDWRQWRRGTTSSRECSENGDCPFQRTSATSTTPTWCVERVSLRITRTVTGEAPLAHFRHARVPYAFHLRRSERKAPPASRPIACLGRCSRDTNHVSPASLASDHPFPVPCIVCT